MIVGFSKHGTGSGKGPVQYLTSDRNPDRSNRIPPPVVLRGDPALVRQLIDALDFKHKYTSGVLSFAPGERITEEMEARIMAEFEKTAFAGLPPDQYSILWVRHTHAGHHELNFLVPRVELATGKSLNIAPPGPAGVFQQKPTVSPCKKTRRWSMNLILISCMGFLVDFRPKMAF